MKLLNSIKFRFSVKTALLAVTLVAFLLSAVLPPRVSFDTVAFDTIYKHADGTGIYGISLNVRNDGILPIWYQEDHQAFDPYKDGLIKPYALGAVRNFKDNKTNYRQRKSTSWMKLSHGQTVGLYLVLGENEIPGIQFQNWLGNKHDLFLPNGEFKRISTTNHTDGNGLKSKD
ncbi:MAG: hypothetical protein AAF939_02025 [Planctomycetota bacterium]